MSLWRATATIGGFTAISRIAGFARDILMTGVLGAGLVADCFVVAFKLPNFFRRLFAEGAFNAAFVPLFTRRLTEDPSGATARHFAEETQAVLLTALLAFTAIVQICMPWVMYVLAPGFSDDSAKFELAVELTRITFPYLLFISLVSLQGGILNACGKFAAVAGTPIILNLTMISAMLWLVPAYPPGHVLAFAVTAGGVLQFLWLFGALRQAGMGLRLRLPRLTADVRQLLKVMAPAAIGAGAMQVNLMVDLIIASFLPAGSISYLFYADRVNQLPIGVIGVAVGTALLPMLSRQVASGHEQDAASTMNRAMEMCLFFTIPCAVASMIVAEPLIATMFERGAFTAEDTWNTAMTLAVFAAGLPAYILVKILTPGFFARHDTATPVRYSIISLVLNTVISLALMKPFAQLGLAAATAIASWINVGLLAWGLHKRGHFTIDARLRQRFPRMLLAAAAMGLALWGASMVSGSWSGAEVKELPRILKLAAIVVGGIAVYGIVSQLVGALRLRELRGLMRGKTDS
ncbi:murein biosynthesis integral membrane protein MurJ [Emcibacter sp. SYSU 3D8]|uniref:murein biosynthesis integral membrane protein MurJ n=1 Tax=Emcibacter sp. SYSU 3D8 TaxID=3133969 RepID=UPI0031FE96CA